MYHRNQIRRQMILSFVARYRQQHGVSPTCRELAQAVGLKSISTLYGYLKRMEQDGDLVMDTHTARSIQLTDQSEQLLRKQA